MTPQDTIQCYTQNQIAGAAQATGRDALDANIIGKVIGAARHAFQQDGGAGGGAGGDGLFTQRRGAAGDEGEQGRRW